MFVAEMFPPRRRWGTRSLFTLGGNTPASNTNLRAVPHVEQVGGASPPRRIGEYRSVREWKIATRANCFR